MMNPFYKEEPSDTRLLPCPSCHEIVDVSTRACRYCGVEIDEATARRLNADFRRVTDAVASANTFKQSIWAAVISTVVGPLYLFLTMEHNPAVILLQAVPVGFLGYAITWRRKYGSLETRDKDYPDAVRSMRTALIIWIAALMIDAVFIGYLLFSGALDR